MSRFAVALLSLASLAAPAVAQQKRYELKSGEDLLADQKICTPCGRCTLTMQGDGNLVWMWGDKVLWDSGTARLKIKNPKLAMQTDGNLVIYGRDADGNEISHWTTDTAGAPGARLVCDLDGNLAIYDGKTVVWSAGTSAMEPAAFKIRVTRPDSLESALYSIDVRVNGKLVGNIKNNETKTFDVPDGRIGRNEITAFGHVSGLQHFPNTYTRDSKDKYAGSKFVAVYHPGETVDAKIGYKVSISGDNVFEVTDEVSRTWVGPYTAKVVFDPILTPIVVKETPPIRLGTGDSKVYEERVRVTQRVEVYESQKVEAGVRAKVTSGFKTVEGGIRTEWHKVTKSTTESETEEVKRMTMIGTGSLKKVKWLAYYRTGVSTVYIDGEKFDVPFKLFDHFDVQTEDVK